MEEIVREKIYAISAERVGEPPVPPHPATPQTTEHAEHTEPQNTLAIGNIGIGNTSTLATFTPHPATPHSAFPPTPAMKRLADKSLLNMGPRPTTRSLALCLEEEIRLGNSFVHCIDGEISMFLLNQPFHRFALNDLVINNQNELSTWGITDALLDGEVRRILDNNLPFPELSGRWEEDVRQFHLELGNLNPYGKGVDERVWSPVPDCYRSVEGLSGLLPTCVGDALGFLLREGNEIELVDDWSPDFFKIVLRHPFELNSVSAFFEHQPAETFSVDDPHYELLTGWSLENEDGSLVVSSGMMPLARRVLLGYLHD